RRGRTRGRKTAAHGEGNHRSARGAPTARRGQTRQGRLPRSGARLHSTGDHAGARRHPIRQYALDQLRWLARPTAKHCQRAAMFCVKVIAAQPQQEACSPTMKWRVDQERNARSCSMRLACTQGNKDASAGWRLHARAGTAWMTAAKSTSLLAYAHSLSYQAITFTKVGSSCMPALASNTEVHASPRMSVETTSSSVYPRTPLRSPSDATFMAAQMAA